MRREFAKTLPWDSVRCWELRRLPFNAALAVVGFR
jgi:hypothetical protein